MVDRAAVAPVSKTFEGPCVTDPQERERLFGQCDHVRQYGDDYGNRLKSASFVVKVGSYARTLSEKAMRYYGLDSNEDIYLCRKPKP